MSTLQVANVHFESTGANRIEYTGNNVVRVQGKGLVIPRIDTANTPSPEPGMMFYNTSTNNMVMMANTSSVVTIPSNTTVDAAFAKANAALANTSGTFAGDLTIKGVTSIYSDPLPNGKCVITSFGDGGLTRITSANTTAGGGIVAIGREPVAVHGMPAGYYSVELWSGANGGTQTVVAANGQLGIGVTPITDKFVVKTNTDLDFGVGYNVAVGNSVCLQAYNDARSLNVPMEIRASSFYFTIPTGNPMTIGANGRIGIGTTSPSQNLSIVASATVSSRAELYGDTNHRTYVYNNSNSGAQQGGIGQGGYIYMSSGGTLSGTKSYASFPSYNMLINNEAYPGFYFVKQANGSTTTDGALTTMFVIDGSNGYVGIGAQPYEPLEIYRSGGGALARFHSPGVSEFKMGIAVGETKFRLAYTPGGGTITGYTSAMEIDTSGRITTPLRPAFYANSDQGSFTVTNGSTIPFNTTRFNIGGHYNTSTYRFTAPIAGVYCFSWSVFQNGGSGRCSFKINNDSVSGQQMQLDNTGSQSMTIYLNANDYVTVGEYQNIGGAVIWLGHSQFSGHLVG